MPWEIRQGTSQCSGYGVFKEGTSELEGCHESRAAAERQMAALYASESSASKSTDPAFEKYRGELYAMLTEEEKAFHDALISIAEQYGPFDLGTSSIWVGYESAEDNEDAEIGVKCSNCSFFNPENNGCAILSYAVEPMGKCRLAAIPDGLVMPEMDREDEEEFVEEMMENMDKQYTGCGCPTCKSMNVACKDCPVCNPEMNKADGVRVGQMVSWNSSGGTARGKVKRIIRDGSYNVPDSEFTITGTPDNPAVVIELYRDGEPTGRMVGHRMNTLRAGKSLQGGVLTKMYSVAQNHPGCQGGWAVVDEDGKLEGCFASKEQADAYAAKENMEEEYEDRIDKLKREMEMKEDMMEQKSIWSSFNPRGIVHRPEVSLFKRDYSSESRRQMAASGQAMPDGSFPIANRTDLRNAIQSVGRASNYAAARRHIIRRARALGATDMLPEDWK